LASVYGEDLTVEGEGRMLGIGIRRWPKGYGRLRGSSKKDKKKGRSLRRRASSRFLNFRS